MSNNTYNNYKFILICGTGRSGSTTLQRIINTIPNTNITGENFGAINNLLECYENLKNTENIPKNINNEFMTYEECEKQKIKPCWYNCYDINTIKSNIQNSIINILDNKQNNNIIGFKEIRYFNKLHLLDTFIELFPNTKIILNYRENIVSQCKSGWWDEDSEQHILSYNNQMIHYYKTHDKNSYLLTFENLFNINKIRELFLFLEEQEQFNKDKYNYIINNKNE
jgi:hypothetical protein